jgi:hypothetical protein
MAVKALFYVQSVEKIIASGSSQNMRVTMMPVIRATDDNIQWSKFTPSGKIEMYITADGAQKYFEENLGKDIPITFG